MAVPERPDRETLRDALARGDVALARITPILGHLLATHDHSLFGDEIIARIRGMLADLAGQILRVQATATGQSAREQFASEHAAGLAGRFHDCPVLLGHCHALALEWQLTCRMESNCAIDPVLSPLIQGLVASEDSGLASAAMAALAAQARFAQAQRRMELPLTELPGDLFHETLLVWRGYNGNAESDILTRAETRIRGSYEEAAGRLSLLARLVAGMADASDAALSIENAGVALFLTALASRSGQSREMAAVSTNEHQMARLALGLRAAGLSPEAIDLQLLTIHPEMIPPAEIADIDCREAAQLLVQFSDHQGD